MTRDKHEREQDRADLLEVLAEADRTGQAPLRTDTLIARANGMHDPALTDTSWWRHYSRGMSDLRALERQGRILGVRDPLSRWARWRLATDEDVDAESDAAEVARMQARWQADDDAAPPTAVEQVEAMVAAGSMRLCRQTGPISEAEAQVLVDFANELRARGARR